MHAAALNALLSSVVERTLGTAMSLLSHNLVGPAPNVGLVLCIMLTHIIEGGPESNAVHGLGTAILRALGVLVGVRALHTMLVGQSKNADLLAPLVHHQTVNSV